MHAWTKPFSKHIFTSSWFFCSYLSGREFQSLLSSTSSSASILLKCTFLQNVLEISHRLCIIIPGRFLKALSKTLLIKIQISKQNRVLALLFSLNRRPSPRGFMQGESYVRRLAPLGLGSNTRGGEELGSHRAYTGVKLGIFPSPEPRLFNANSIFTTNFRRPEVDSP